MCAVRNEPVYREGSQSVVEVNGLLIWHTHADVVGSHWLMASSTMLCGIIGPKSTARYKLVSDLARKPIAINDNKRFPQTTPECFVHAVISTRVNYYNVTTSLMYIYARSSRFWTALHAWSPGKESSTASLQHFGSTFADSSEYTTNYVFLCTCLHHTAPSYLSAMSVPMSTDPAHRSLRSAANGDLLILRTKLQATVHVVLLFLALGAGTVCHRHWNRRHCQ